MGKLTIDPEVISTHAARVDQVAADIRTALDAANSTDMGGGAFGVLCAFLVPAADEVTGAARGMIGAAGDMVSRSATELRGAASDFDRLESDRSSGVSAMESGI